MTEINKKTFIASKISSIKLFLKRIKSFSGSVTMQTDEWVIHKKGSYLEQTMLKAN
jgi:hypothetical protein